ncbi:flagellar basal body-associated FliL family protein [Vibrio sp. SM6]|uniref:Flagellar protein FliL n=1 Tax=Vibrio agarilyticus TaxID=2726741 RepID=A0A7X8YHL8_9VIBR|nr:flagellar basal body-associated FliL family protein [Vibrio agarilyticus]NLS13720.1 flagellar basal body-associated FliL family protein [Vibrio agarilyticus]
MTKKQLVGFTAIVLLCSALISVGTMMAGVWYLKQTQQTPSNVDANQASWFDVSALFGSKSNEQHTGPHFHPLEKVVLSIKGDKQTHFVMLELAVETRSPERIESLDNYMPKVQNALLRLFADKHYRQLQQQGAVEELQQEVKNTLLGVFERTTFANDIDDVLLTKYVVQ